MNNSHRRISVDPRRGQTQLRRHRRARLARQPCHERQRRPLQPDCSRVQGGHRLRHREAAEAQHRALYGRRERRLARLGRQPRAAGATVRGVVTNVSNYNQYIAPVRENYTEWSPSWDETHFVSSLAPYLIENGVPAHFIVDQGRGGQGGIRTEWGQWCNIRNAGFGSIPTADQAVLQNQYVDALVWVKPGGESDGTSDRSSSRFDETCALPVAHVPAPEAGTWFNEYVANLVRLANPPLQPTY